MTIKKLPQLVGVLALAYVIGFETTALGVSMDPLAFTKLATPLRTKQRLTTQHQAQATQWHLTKTEWQRYKKLMQGPAGRWYAKLDPPEVLGLLAKNDAEQMHYAELVVKQRKARIDHELAFNRAVHAAWLREYPRLKPIRAFDTRPFNVVKHTH